jgi:ketosteroid isomerase-like protein
MSEQNLELARQIVAAFRKPGRETPSELAALTHPEIEMDTTRLAVPGLAEVWKGREEVARFWLSWLDAWTTYGEFEDPELIDAGDQLVAYFARHEMKGTESGVAVPMPAYAWVWSIRDGTVWRATIYMDRAEALAAAGLSNVEVIRRMLDAFQAGDAGTALACLATDVEWDGTNLPDGRVGRGHQAVLDHLGRWADTWDEWTVDVEQIRAAEDEKVFVLIRERGRSSSGLEMDERHAELYTVRDGRVVHRVGFSDPAEALEAARL